MFSFLLTAAAISLTGVMMPGPLFAVTVAKSYRSGLAGLQAAAGHAVVEVPLMVLVYLGVAQFFKNSTVQIVFSFAGALMLLWLGFVTLRMRNSIISKDPPYSSIAAGVATSALNPFFLLWWATIGSVIIGNSLAFGLTGFTALVVVHWLCDAGWLSFVSVLVYRTHSLWGRGFQQGLFIICSLLLFGFGGWFLVSAVRLIT